MLTIHGRATSSNVQAVMWTVAELGLPHRRLDVGGAFGGTDTPAFRAMNPNGLVPVLEDGDLAIFESAAIVRYLAARYGSEAFWPADPRARAPLDAWAEWAKGSVARTFIMEIFWQIVRMGPERMDAAVVRRGAAQLRGLMDIAEARLAGRPFLCGESLTPADIWLGHVLYRYFDVDFPRGDHPNLRAYYDRLAARPAYAAHVMVSYDSLRGQYPRQVARDDA